MLRGAGMAKKSPLEKARETLRDAVDVLVASDKADRCKSGSSTTETTTEEKTRRKGSA